VVRVVVHQDPQLWACVLAAARLAQHSHGLAVSRHGTAVPLQENPPTARGPSVC
jgi:hypothetical protein